MRHLIFVAIIHVGDIIACGTNLDLAEFPALIRAFGEGGAAFPNHVQEMVFRGPNLNFSKPLSIGFPQNAYRGTSQPLRHSDFFGTSRICRARGQILIDGKKFIGIAIWVSLSLYSVRVFRLEMRNATSERFGMWGENRRILPRRNCNISGNSTQ